MKHYVFENAAVRLGGTNAAREFFAPMFIDRDRELLLIALCDENVRLLHLLSIPGSGAYVEFSVRKVMKQAVRADSAAVIVAHNHPSGDTRPSGLDLRITRRLSLAAEALGITLLDHLIFGGSALSFRENGYL